MQIFTGLFFGVYLSRKDVSTLCPASQEPSRGGGWEPPFQGCSFHGILISNMAKSLSLQLCSTSPKPQPLWLSFPKETFATASCFQSPPSQLPPSEVQVHAPAALPLPALRFSACEARASEHPRLGGRL